MKHDREAEKFDHQNEPQPDEPEVSLMRRVSLSLAFNPARIRRRSRMEEENARRSRWWGGRQERQ